MARRLVTARATFTAPGVIVVTVDGPKGSTSSETVAATGHVASCARRLAEACWAGTTLDVQVRASRPPWLAEGDLVRLSDGAADPEDGNEPYGQVVGFVDEGGVMIVQSGAGAGIHAPEDLTVVNAEGIDPEALADIVKRAGGSPLPGAG